MRTITSYVQKQHIAAWHVPHRRSRLQARRSPDSRFQTALLPLMHAFNYTPSNPIALTTSQQAQPCSFPNQQQP